MVKYRHFITPSGVVITNPTIEFVKGEDDKILVKIITHGTEVKYKTKLKYGKRNLSKLEKVIIESEKVTGRKEPFIDFREYFILPKEDNYEYVLETDETDETN